MIDASQAERELRRLAEGREVVLATIMQAEKKGKTDSMPYQNYLIRQAIEELTDDIKADLKKGSGARAYKKFAQYLGTIDPRLASLRAIQAILGVLLREGGADAPQPVWKKAAYAAGQAVYAEYLMQHFKKLNPALFNSLSREYSRSMTRDERHLLAAFKAKFAQTSEVPFWSFGDIENMGSYVLTRLVEHRFLESWSKTEFKKGKAYTQRYLMLDEGLRNASLEIMDKVADLPRVAGPLIEPPLDWDPETNTGGGFHTPDMQRLSAYAVQGKGLGRVAETTVATLNALQRRAYRINVPVLQAVREVSLLQDFGDVVSPIRTDKPEHQDSFTPEEKKAWKSEARKWYTEKKVRKVKHMRAQKVFQEAQELAQYPTIWFSYYADFRGRAYVRSSSVSPQGTDLEKGLLSLSNGKPLTTTSSVDWFKIHGANKFGKDKLTLAERIKWVDDNGPEIELMGMDPTGHRGWTEADEPVQFLAWAVEYATWRSDPDGFLSHLPLGQDGTCNGLQNYSALVCDPVGGAAVNLTPADAPRDIYADVAVRVTELLQQQPPSPLRDGWLAHGLNRKITKRPTMTLPYGSTRFAASSFIMDYIEEHGMPEVEAGEWGNAANYLSHLVWAALEDNVGKAMEVMTWLQGWAKYAISTGQRVQWTAPSGLQVSSEYESDNVVRVRSVAFKTRIQLYKPNGKPDVRKTANAVAPNFVHSLDASHMARVVLAAEAEGMEPVVIHDDFGVHAADTERFHEIIREQFIAMYQDNTILQDMADSIGYKVPPPETGSLDLRDVLRSPYFFS